MAKWVISGTTFDWNPNRDSGWKYTPVRAIHHPISADSSIIQHGGFNSPTRTISGVTKLKSLRDAVTSAFLSGNPVACSDQDGVAFTAWIDEAPFEVKIDTSNDTNNYQSYTYMIVLTKR